MGKLKAYSSFVKVEHTLFSLPLILSGSFLAERGLPDIRVLILIIIAAFGARTSALGINRIIDREIDKRNPRTKGRELPSGKISLWESYAIVGVGVLIYFISAYFICNLAFYLSPIPLLVFTLYPYMKRFTSLCHFGVGLGLSLAPLGGWIAVRCSLNDLFPPILLSLFTFFWVSEFRSIYAIVFLIISGLLLFLEHKKSSDVDLAFFKVNAVLGFIVFFFVLSGIYLS